MGPDKRRSESQIAVCVHPPERRRRPGTVAACGCCCCCCCCLHSLGGLIAASTAGKSRTPEEQSATSTYWLCLLAALAITTFGSILATGDPMSPLLILVLLPAYQIATSVVAAIIGGLRVGAPAVSRIWSITWRAFLGAVIGLGIMMSIFFGFSGEPGALFLTVLGLIVVVGFWYYSTRRKRASLSPASH